MRPPTGIERTGEDRRLLAYLVWPHVPPALLAAWFVATVGALLAWIYLCRLVLREGMWLSGIGCALGLAMALGIGALLSAVLYGLKPVEAPVFVAVTALLLGVSAIACYLPARRASQLDPVLTLRRE